MNGSITRCEASEGEQLREASPAGRPTPTVELRPSIDDEDFPWAAASIELARTPSLTYAGDRKIHVGRTVIFDDGFDFHLTVERAGYTAKKMQDLTRLYLHEESRASALDQWREKISARRRKPFSVGFHTYNHLLKADRKHGVGSVMGPCMQSVAVSWWNGRVFVDVHYRTVEFFRAFVADLVFLRDVLLAPFDLHVPIVRCHFANVTCHPRDFPIVLCNVFDPLDAMMKLKRADRRFHVRVVRWLSSYICEERGHSIANYDRGKRGRDAVLRMLADDDLDDLREYCRRQLP